MSDLLDKLRSKELSLGSSIQKTSELIKLSRIRTIISLMEDIMLEEDIFFDDVVRIVHNKMDKING